VTEAPATAPTRVPVLLLIVTGGIGLLAAFILAADKVQLLEDKLAGREPVFACNLNAFVNCGNVMDSPQSSVFGFPNAFLGVVGFSVVLTLGVAWAAGAPSRGWIWAGLQTGTMFGIGLVTWLQYQSIYVIGSLCPYCMVVWAVMIPLFVAVTARTLRDVAPNAAISRFASNWTVLIVALWYIAVAAAIWFHFGTRLWA